ncbi:MAG: hypothetical protein DMD79_03640 [Candidatus Rokuibacteriota bacterium]|nr:MAG: hypothetical protein DMD79_03640 [Candidatus Rokubacteria bacterium]
MRRAVLYGAPDSLLADCSAWLPGGLTLRPWPEVAPGAESGPPADPRTGAPIGLEIELEGPAVLLVAAEGDLLARAVGVAAGRPGLVLVAVGDRPTLPEASLPEVSPRPFAWLRRDAPGAVARTILDAAVTHAELAHAHAMTRSDTARLARELADLTRIGIMLSAERDTDILLELILAKAREITVSDAGSLYLVETDAAGRRHLRFMLVQNDSRHVPYKESTLDIGSQSLAGHVALTGQALNLADAYHPPGGAVFQIDPTFDAQTGYQTKSMLVVPMKVPTGEILGVLQLINHKADRAQRLGSPADVERAALPFPLRAEEQASFLASQAAVAIANARLYAELRTAVKSLEESQRRIIQGERLRALGEMATGVAHDFNNLLAVIVGRAQLLLRQTKDPDLTRQLDAIEQAGQDGARTVRRIQEFARTRRHHPFRPVDLSQVVGEVVEAARPRWQAEARVRGVVYDVRVQGAPGPVVTCDPGELRESLQSIFLNALDAMPGGGLVTLTTGLRDGWATCAIADTGCGMAEAVRRRVFEPFFTTKAEQGTGLGLSIAYGIVTRHGGEIDVESRPGAGSVFTVRLPVSAPATGPPRTVAEGADRPARVLVVEDQTPVRSLLAELLVEMGHEVVVAADGREALACLEAGAFDLVMIDLGLPGLPGLDVVAAARRRRPGVPVVLATGWPHQLVPGEVREAGIDHVVGKPFDVESLAALVKAAMAAGR